MNSSNLTNQFVETITRQQEVMAGWETGNLFDLVRVYFVTVTYTDCFSTLDAEKKLQTMHRLQDKFFGHLLNKTVPRYMKPKNRKYQPVSLDFVDFPGTKKSFGDTLSAPHVHSILVAHPKTQARFDRLMNSDFLISKENVKTSAIQSVRCLPIPNSSELRGRLGYSMKFYYKAPFQFRDNHIRTQLYAMRGGESALPKVSFPLTNEDQA